MNSANILLILIFACIKVLRTLSQTTWPIAKDVNFIQFQIKRWVFLKGSVPLNSIDEFSEQKMCVHENVICWCAALRLINSCSAAPLRGRKNELVSEMN